MANKFQIKSNRLAVHESSSGDWLHSASMPILLCGSGTAQVNRVWGTMERLSDVGCLDRVQSALLYDINNDTTRRITNKGRRMKSSLGTEIYFPQFIPTDTGFHRDPYGYIPYSGTLFEEQDQVVEEIGERADQLGTPPQLIIHFMGFGSHCLLGAILHNRLKNRFPLAKSLVILDIPREAALHEQMADVWDEMMELLPDEKFLVTDDRMGDPFVTDHKLACALATIEASSQSGPWLGISCINAYRLPVKKVWSGVPPFRRTRLVRGKADELTMLGIRAAKDTLKSQFDLANYNDRENRARSMIFCSVPLKMDEIPVLESKVQHALDNEGFFKENPYASFSVASANMPNSASVRYIPNLPVRRRLLTRLLINTVGHLWKAIKLGCISIYGRDSHTPYLHCVRLYPLTDINNPKMDIESLRSVLYDNTSTIQKEVDVEPEIYTNGEVVEVGVR